LEIELASTKNKLDVQHECWRTAQENYERQVTNCSKEWASRYDVLMKKYMEECAERRSLHNEFIELRGNIRVFCRCRPLNDKYISVVEIDPEKKNAL